MFLLCQPHCIMRAYYNGLVQDLFDLLHFRTAKYKQAE